MSWTLTSSHAAIVKAGKNANTTLIADGASMAILSDQAEGLINTATRKDWVTDYAAVTTNFKPILDDVASDLIAMKIINYDMSGYSSRLEAGTMLDFLSDNSGRSLKILGETENKEVMD